MVICPLSNDRLGITFKLTAKNAHRFIKNKLQGFYKPDSVLQQVAIPVIYLIGLPSEIERAALSFVLERTSSVYMAFQPTRFYQPQQLPAILVGSYPTFSPLSARGGRFVSVSLSVNFCCQKPPGFSSGIALCVARTFLPLPKSKERQGKALQFISTQRYGEIFQE